MDLIISFVAFGTLSRVPDNSLTLRFRETVFLAIKLNRTIIPPPFYKHDRTDESKDEGMCV